ncbi:hypothetical protein DUNSADRAFT_9715 [Dunaliella salina]|uniref:2Fe-2S ferredoxin-type domain-containing protein n=1 Tax=Dunaliella salina TaxID=3046 RepID=A0ABQ7GGV9_DUNSA|nr:hypothetical protein DUNSADRAFT_9715 [Dunaliella salina]|eukprot:KAF5833841.1 hypothetical protein DUNSADRAFT_9715 [Dunaliella salina]
MLLNSNMRCLRASQLTRLNSGQSLLLQPLNHNPSTFAAHASSDARGTQGNEECVSLVYRGLKLEARKGARVRTALLKAGVSPHNGDAKLINCRGLGTCGTCAVQISGNISPKDLTPAEKLRLNFPPHKAPNNQRLRLACQVKLQGDVTVIKFDQFWGQGSLPLGPLQPVSSHEAQNRFESTGVDGEGMDLGKTAVEPKSRLGLSCTPLGNLEFLLDSESGVK